MKKIRLLCLIPALFVVVAILTDWCFAYSQVGEDTCIARITVADAEFSKAQGSVGDTVMGAIVADAVRICAGADIAAIPCGEFSGEMIGVKSLTFGELIRLLPEDSQIMTVYLSPKQLKGLLEYAVSFVVLDSKTKQVDLEQSISDVFVQLSGMKLVYDTSAPVGSRVYSVSVDGIELDLNDDTPSLLFAGTELLFNGGLGFPVVEGVKYNGMTCVDAVVEYLNGSDVISEYNIDRIQAIGNSDNRIISQFPVVAVLFVAIMAVLSKILIIRLRKQSSFEPCEGWSPWQRGT